MIKISLSLLLLFLTLSNSFSQTKGIAHIKGKVLSGKVRQVKFGYIYYNPITIKGTDYFAQLDANSQFSVDIPIEGLADGTLVVGNHRVEISLLPGDDLFITIDNDKITYTGKGAAKNTFLYDLKINNLSTAHFGRMNCKVTYSLNELYTKTTALAQERLRFFEEHQLHEQLDAEFAKSFKIRTEILTERVLRDHVRMLVNNKKTTRESLNLPKEYQALYQFSKVVSDERAPYLRYITDIGTLIRTMVLEALHTNPKLNSETLYKNILNDSISGITKEYILTRNVISGLNYNRIDSARLEKFNTMKKSPLAQRSVDLAMKKYRTKTALLNQPLHPAFSNSILIDTNGKELTFGEMMQQHKGKVVYIDFWYMSCPPCRQAMPFAKKLKEELTGEPIEFVYISQVKIKPKGWEKVYKVTSTTKNHYVMKNGYNSQLNKYMKIQWAPNYMIFDKEGKLISFCADRPSEENSALLETLRKLGAE